MNGRPAPHPDMVSQSTESPGSGSEPGRTEQAVSDSADEAAGSNVAIVRVAIELTDGEKSALTQALERRFGYPIRLVIEVDSRILGGVWVQVSDTIIDGSVQGRLEALRHHLRASSRAIVLGSERSLPDEGDEV